MDPLDISALFTASMYLNANFFLTRRTRMTYEAFTGLLIGAVALGSSGWYVVSTTLI
jgi:hypothetical protein